MTNERRRAGEWAETRLQVKGLIQFTEAYIGRRLTEFERDLLTSGFRQGMHRAAELLGKVPQLVGRDG